jgi:hypothetical protein
LFCDDDPVDVLAKHNVLSLNEHREPRELESVKRYRKQVNIGYREVIELIWHRDPVLAPDRLTV